MFSYERTVNPMTTVDKRTGLIPSLEHIRRTPLDVISLDQADGIVRDVFDRKTDEQPVAVARFGSSI